MSYEQLSREALLAALLGPIQQASPNQPAVADGADAVDLFLAVPAQPAIEVASPMPRHALDAVLDADLPPQVRHRLAAARELMLRALAGRMASAPMMESPQAVKDWLVLQCCGLQHEVFWVLFLDVHQRLIEAEPMFRGTLTQTSIYPREVVKAALRHNAAAVVLAHNHPSGQPEPSRSDEFLTKTLKAALMLVDVRVLDHFVVAGNRTLSFAERGLL